MGIPTEDTDAARRADRLTEKLEEANDELETTRARRKEAEKEHAAKEAEAVEAEALAGVVETDTDPGAAQEAATATADEVEALREKERILEKRVEVLSEKANEAAEEAQEETAAMLKEHVGTRVEAVAETLNRLAKQMEQLKEANQAWQEANARLNDNPYASNGGSLWMNDMLAEQRTRGAVSKPKLARWFEKARANGFDVELKHGHWATDA